MCIQFCEVKNLERFKKFGEKTWHITSVIGAVFIVFYMLLTVANIIMRRAFNAPIFGVTEMICYASMVACCFGLAQTAWKDGNVSMTIIHEMLPPRARRAMYAAEGLVSTIGVGYVAYQCILQIFVKFRTGGTTTDTGIPLYILTIFLAMGFVFLCICLFMKFIIRVYEINHAPEVKSDNDSSEATTA